jgi:stress response protein YsnF
MRHDQASGQDTSLPLAEEVVSLDRRETVTGRVRVTTAIDTDQHFLETDLREEHVEVSRVAIGRVVDTAPVVRTEGDVTIIPVLEEIAVVETRLLLREEVHLRRVARRHAETVPVTLRRQRAVVERDGEPVDPKTAPTSEEDPPT